MTIRLMCGLFAPVLVIAAIGCEKWGGGASVVPSVTFLPADLSGDVTGTETVAGGADDGAPTTAAGGVGSIVGRVVFQGDAPTLPPLYAKGATVKDSEVCAHDEDIIDDKFRVGANNGVANVFVYLPRAPKGAPAPAPPEEPLVFDQKNCRFEPHCMIVPTKYDLKVLSDDAIAHNTHTNPSKNDPVNSLVPANDREGSLVINYKRSESAPLYVQCDFHAWMSAYHLPLDHNFAAVTDADGNFEIKDLPAGDYEFTVWHEAAAGKYIERKLPVTVTGGDPTSVEIPYPAAKLAL